MKQFVEIDQELHRLNHLEKEFRELLCTVAANEHDDGEYVAVVGASPLQDHRIQVDDQLDVKLFFNPDRNQEVTVRPDGRISLQLVGKLMASGRTVDELKVLLKQRYEDELKNPTTTGLLRSFNTNIETSRRAGKRSR